MTTKILQHVWPAMPDWGMPTYAKGTSLGFLIEASDPSVISSYERDIPPQYNESPIVLDEDYVYWGYQNVSPKFRDSRDGPLCKVTTRLLDTYNTVNQKYYTKQTDRRPEQEDKNGAYLVQPGEVLMNRYSVVNKIGSGAFGVVVSAFDQLRHEWVAIKIINRKPLFLKQARVERSLLLQLRSADPSDDFHIVRIRESFEHRGHPCIVFDLLSRNLFEILRSTNFSGLSLRLVRTIAHQMLQTLSFLARPDVNVIHADVKLENILLRREDSADFALVDFGAACRSQEQVYTYIQSRFYRAPEVILGIRYSFAIDMWSLGCCLVELLTGYPLFPGQNEVDQLAKIIEVVGWPKPRMLQASSKGGRLFKISSNGVPILRGPTATQPVPFSRPLERVLKNPRTKFFQDHPSRWDEFLSFQDLAARMLKIDPSERILPDQALQHPFLN